MAGKRSHGEGNVSQLKSGTWRGQLMDGYTPEGKKNIISFLGTTKSEVLRKIREYQTQKEANIHVDRKMLFKEWAEQWYSDYRTQVQPSTYCNYRYTLNILNNNLGSKRLASILPIDINNLMDCLVSKYSASQISKCRAMLIQIFDAADANGLISRNPARHAKNLKNHCDPFAHEVHSKDSFTTEEILFLNRHLENDLMGNSIRLMLGTGIRVQELLALTSADIAEDGSSLCVDKAVKTVAGKSVLGSPKSKRGNRLIPVPDAYRPCALYLRNTGLDKPYIWTSSWKNPLYNTKAFRSKYTRALSAIPAVRPLTPHCCRHTYITQLQAKGVPMEIIARLVGHSKIQTTDGYLHTSTDTLMQATSVLNDSCKQ